MNQQPAPEDWTVAELCPGCCTIDDIPEYTPSVEILTPLVDCTRCGFRFPVLPDQFKRLTLDSLHSHDCSGIHEANWPELGQAIVDAIHQLGESPDEFAKRLEGLWPGEEPSSGEEAYRK